jgi:cytoskeletal protein RodZ
MFEPRKPLPWRAIMTFAWAMVAIAAGWFGYRYFQARKASMANANAPAAVASIVPDVEQVAPKTEETAPANVTAPIAVPSTAIVPQAAPSVAAAPAPMASAAVVAPAIPHAAASPLGKSKSSSHAASHMRTPLKSASAARRLSMQN